MFTQFYPLLWLLIFGFAAIQDGRSLSYHWWPSLFIPLLIGIAEVLSPSLGLYQVLIALGILFVGGLLINYYSVPLGNGDIWLICLTVLAFPWDIFLIILGLSCIVGICYYLALQVRWQQNWDARIPFVSIIWLVALWVEVFSWYVNY